MENTDKEREEWKMFGICLVVFIGLCIYHACEPTIPAEYHRNWRLEQEDADKVRFGQMSQRESLTKILETENTDRRIDNKWNLF